MGPRLIFFCLCMTLIGGALLALRQRELATTHAMSLLVQQANSDRIEQRSLQAELSRCTSPDALRAACAAAGLELVPLQASSVHEGESGSLEPDVSTLPPASSRGGGR